MPVKLVFLGRLEDAAGAAERYVAAAETLDALIAALEPELAAELRQDRIRLALNGVLRRPGEIEALRDGDELAFLPPVSGG
jgi:molybdopterin synthase sulfur carrier subunit